MPSQIVNLKDNVKYDVYVGRGSDFGNPFSHQKYGSKAKWIVDTRDEAIECYHQWLLEQPELIQKVKKELKNKILACYCDPLRCHAEVLMEIANQIEGKGMIKIFDDCFYFPNALSLLQQKQLIKIYLKYKNDLYIPKLKTGNSMNLKMTCLGKHWSPFDYKYYDTRNDHDQKLVKPIEPKLIEFAKQFSLQAFPYHNPDWNIAIINQYNNRNTLGIHADNSESQASLSIGHPVISISVGASANFRIGGFTKNSETKDITLNSGDIVIFGGESRLRYHGITRIYNNLGSPFAKFTNNTRINFTLRKY